MWDMALYDIPAAIKKVRNVTGLQKIKYIGQSQGTMTMHIALHYSQYVRDSISHYIGMAPIISLKNMKSQVNKIAK